MIKAPCKNCTDRSVAGEPSCHAVCPKYKEYREAQDALNAKIKQDKNNFALSDALLFNHNALSKHRRKPNG